MVHSNRSIYYESSFRNCCFTILLSILICVINSRLHKRKIYHFHNGKTGGLSTAATKTLCMQIDNTLKARHKTCFLRPDTGPCRADLIQWYFDAKQSRCYQFFWGGCQGNGNKFESKDDCMNYCKLNITAPILRIPHYCSVMFDYGTCFGHFYRWGWDKLSNCVLDDCGQFKTSLLCERTCKRYMYSGCGGNQNNFQTRNECLDNCLNPPNNTLQGIRRLTTCIPLNFIAV